MTPVTPDVPVPVALRGLYRGHDVTGPVLLLVGADRLTLTGPELRRPIVLPYALLDGLATAATADGGWRLTLFERRGDVLELAGDARLRDAAALAERGATALPELTRALRAVGTPRGHPGAEHDRFFAPLLEARARAERASGWSEQLAAFAPAALRAEWARTLADFAVARHPHSAPDRRALEAALGESLESVELCVTGLERAAAAVHAADDASRLRRWREWVDEVARLFEAADRCWLVALRELDAAPLPAAPPPPRPGLWARLRGRGA